MGKFAALAHSSPAMDNPLDTAIAWFASGSWTDLGGRVLAATTIMGAVYVLVWLMRKGLERLRKHAKAASSLIYIVEQVLGYALIVAGILAGFAALGLNLSSFTVFAGAIGVGVGLGLQGVVKEFVSGLVLIFDPAIQIGDFVELESGLRGELVEIGPRATRLRTNDDLNVVIPNSKFMQGEVINWTYNDQSRRIHVAFSVAEEADKALVRDVVMAAARSLPFTLPDHDRRKTQVWLTGFGGNGLDFELIVWPSLEFSRHPSSLHAAYTWAIHEALRAAGVDNSSPQLDLRLRNFFGREGDEALKTLHLKNRETAPTADPAAKRTPNDAAMAVFDDVARDSQTRAAEAQKREKRA